LAGIVERTLWRGRVGNSAKCRRCGFVPTLMQFIHSLVNYINMGQWVFYLQATKKYRIFLK